MEQAKTILSGCLFISKDTIADDAEISSLGKLDSLIFEMIATEIEMHIKGDIDPIKLLDLRTVRDLADMLEQETV